jgi:hypothetical protein
MSIVPDKIINPVGLDAVIQECQEFMEVNLSEVAVVYGKAYKTEMKEETKPEVYLKKNEYVSVFPDDRIVSSAFFDVQSDNGIEYNGNTSEYAKTKIIRFIVMGNLDKIYADFSHRADENLKLDVENTFKQFRPKLAKDWKLTDVIENVEDVFSNYSFPIRETLNNMQPYVVLGFEFEVSYNNKNKC